MTEDSLYNLGTDLERISETIVRHSRGAGAKVVNRIAAAARELALTQYNPYGHGRQGAAGTIEARMSKNQARVIGYVFGEGSVFHQEFGTSRFPPQPVLGPAAAQHADDWAAAIADAALGSFEGSSWGGGGAQLQEYTTRSGKTRMATPAQIAHWTRNQ